MRTLKLLMSTANVMSAAPRHTAARAKGSLFHIRRHRLRVAPRQSLHRPRTMPHLHSIRNKLMVHGFVQPFVSLWASLLGESPLHHVVDPPPHGPVCEGFISPWSHLLGIAFFCSLVLQGLLASPRG